MALLLMVFVGFIFLVKTSLASMKCCWGQRWDGASSRYPLLPGETPNDTMPTVTLFNEEPFSTVKKVHPSIGLTRLVASPKSPMPLGDFLGTVVVLPLLVSVGFVFMVKGSPKHPVTGRRFQPWLWLTG